MATDNIFTGVVSTLFPDEGEVVVTRDDKDGMTTARLKVLNRATCVTKSYWMPCVGDQVLCITLSNPSGKQRNAGYVLGAIYSEPDPPPEEYSATTRVLDHKGDVVWRIDGTFKIRAKKIDFIGETGDVIVSGISLVHHVHTGCSGGTTGEPVG